MGDTSWLVKNPDTQKLYSFDAAMWDLIELFDGSRTRPEILEAYDATHSGEGIPLQLVLDFEEQLRDMGLIARSAKERSLALLEGARTARKRAAEEKAEGFNPFFIQYKVIDPDRILTRTAKYVRWIWSPPVVSVGLVCFALTVGVFVQHFDALWSQTLELYAFLKKPFWDAVQFFLILTCIGAIHEFSHGYVTKFYGGEVHDIGMALFYFTPAFYCDTTDAFLFESKWHRFWVTVAGIYVEAWMCAIATGLWVASYPDTLLHELAYKTMLFTGVSTIFFNINPLIKIDGYYALSNLLELPALREDSFAYIGAWIQRHVLRLNVEVPALSRRRRRIYVLYGVLASAYAATIMVFIGKLFDNLYSKYFPQFATILLIVTLYQVFKKRVRVVTRVARLLYLDKKELLMSPRARAPLAAAAIAVLLFLAIPWSRRTIQATVLLEPTERISLQAPDDGLVAQVLVGEGSEVAVATPVAVLTNPALEARLDALNAVRERLEKEASRLRQSGSPGDARRADSERSAVEADIRREEARRERMTLRSPIAGRVLTPRLEDLVGKRVRSGDVLAEIGDCRRVKARIPVSERLLTQFSIGEPVAVQLRGRPLQPLRGSIVSIAPATFTAEPASAKDRPGLRPPERPETFVAVAEFENPGGLLRPGMSGIARIYSGRSSYLARSGRILGHWLQTIFW
jgi:putative peptide zinc metalloprotease protein